MTHKDKIALRHCTHNAAVIMSARFDDKRAQKIRRLVDIAKRGILRWRDLKFILDTLLEYERKWEENKLDFELLDVALCLDRVVDELTNIKVKG